MKKIIFLISILFFSCQEKTEIAETPNTGIMWFNDNPDHTTIIIEGIQHFENIEFEKAYVFFEKAIKLDSTLFAPHVMLASISLPNSPQQEYHYGKAKELVQGKNENSKRFVSLLDNPNQYGNRNILGRGDKTAVWEAMIAEAPDGPFIQFYHAWSRTTLEDRIVSMESLLEKRIAAGESANGHILNVLGYSYVQFGDLDKAKSTFEQYMEIYPEGYNAYDSMAEFYFNQKDYENAKIYYEKALQAYPGANSANQKIRQVAALLEE